MSIKIHEMIASGKKLTKDEIQYAKDRGIAVPGVHEAGSVAELPVSATGAGPVVTPDVPGMPALEDDTETVILDDMTKKELRSFAKKEKGITFPKGATKADMIEALAEDDTEDEDEEETTE